MKQRFITLDAIKVFAAISIVWLHTVSSPQLAFTSVLGRFAVPFFTSTAVFFIFTKVIQTPTVSFHNYAVSRFKRIYIPFLIWSVLYLLIRYLNCLVTKLCTNINLELNFFWTGSTNHLWFLPFILVVSLSAFLLAKIVAKNPKYQLCLALITLTSGILILIKPNYHLINQLGYTVSLSYLAIPAALWGITVAVVYSSFKPIKSNDFLPFLSIVIVTIISILMLIQGRNISWENLGGICFLIAAISCPDYKFVFLDKIAGFGKYSYGIYLVHILFVESFQDIASLLNMSENLTLDISVFLLSIVFSVQTISLLSKFKLQTWFGI